MTRKESERPIKKNASKRKIENVTCPKCFKIYKSRKTLREHLDIHNEGCPYFCKQCPKTFKTRQALRLHTEFHSSPFPCDLCDKVFPCKSKYEAHKRRHNKEYKRICLLCNIGYMTNKSYFNHMFTKHGENREKLVLCEFCGQEFCSKFFLDAHRVSRHWNEFNEKPLEKPECIICKKLFHKRSALQTHMKNCHPIDDISVLCGICGKRVSNKLLLKAHEKTHSNYKPHECKVCMKAFQRRYQLAEHMRVHTGERPYECTICGQKFTQLSPLKRHIRTVHGEKKT